MVDYVKRVAGPSVGFQIEIRTNPEYPERTYSDKRFSTALAKFLVQKGIVDRSEVQDFSFQTLLDLQKINPHIKTAYLTDKEAEITVHKSDSRIASLLSAVYQLKNFSYSVPHMIKSLGGTLWDPQDIELTKQSLDYAHRLGLKVLSGPSQKKLARRLILKKLKSSSIGGSTALSQIAPIF